MRHLSNISLRLEKFFGTRFLNRILYQEFSHQVDAPFNERAVEYAFVFKQLAKYCPGTILDVGTGMTALPHVMRNCNFKVTAIDNVTDYWANGMFNRHYFVIDDDITDSKLDQKFDCITCISTLEHIVNFNKAVENMSNLLNTGGIAVITFPYNEKKYCPNVYELPDSKAPKNLPFITQAFSRAEIDHWCKTYNLVLVEQEYWGFFTGEYWSTGERLPFPEQSTKLVRHQNSCIVFQKG